jgi:biotin synthase-related radical SAM superfamily protein
MIRVAIGTAGVLGLANIKMDATPTTAHIMTSGKCIFDCKFCTQARSSNADQKLLSRISWPEYEEEKFFNALKEKQNEFKRTCLQVVHSEGNEVYLRYLKRIKEACDLPISIDLKADNMGMVKRAFEAGADVVGLPVDAANSKIYSEIKQGSLSSQMELIKQAAKEFKGKISTHLMIGLGESERDAVLLMREMQKNGVTTALFAFTPIKGTALENRKQPNIAHYRRIQAARFLIYNDFMPNIKFDENGKILNLGFNNQELLNKLEPSAFQTTGCPDCNRPFYNERPGGELYNYPYVPSKEEHKRALQEATVDLE